ncbi:MAG: hypothetical protein RLZZ171_901 [Cyanobacteriota bacterium]|jgi:hypothetical protein
MLKVSYLRSNLLAVSLLALSFGKLITFEFIAQNKKLEIYFVYFEIDEKVNKFSQYIE